MNSRSNFKIFGIDSMNYVNTRRSWVTGAITLTLSMLLGAISPPLLADEAAEMQQVSAGMSKLLPGVKVDSIKPAELDGLYEVLIGTQIYYVSKDGNYLLTGKLFDIAKREDLTSPKMAEAKLKAVEAVGEDNMVIFAPEKYSHTITVFTDIDCGYCRKLHSEIDEYNKLGIRVRYMLFPRAGVESDSYHKAVAVWCSSDRKAALTKAKKGEEIEMKECENPVKKHMELGQQLGVTGTPAIFLSSGELVPGYVPPARLLTALNQAGSL